MARPVSLPKPGRHVLEVELLPELSQLYEGLGLVDPAIQRLYHAALAADGPAIDSLLDAHLAEHGEPAQQAFQSTHTDPMDTRHRHEHKCRRRVSPDPRAPVMLDPGANPGF